MASSATSEEDTAAQEAKDAEVAVWVDQGEEAVKKHKLKEAENVLLKAWTGLRPEHPDADRLHMRLLFSLAEIYSKRARISKEEMESYWKFLQSITLLKMTLKICDKALVNNSVSNDLNQWLNEQRNVICNKYKLLEVHVVKLFYNRVKYFDQFAEKEENPSTETEADLWMKNLVAYCEERLGHLCTVDEEIDQEPEIAETDSSVSEKDDAETDQKLEENEVPKIEFETLQNTIQSLIRKMTLESKQQHLKELKKELANIASDKSREDVRPVEIPEMKTPPKGIMIHRTHVNSLPKQNSGNNHDQQIIEQSHGNQMNHNKNKTTSQVAKRKSQIQGKKNVSFVAETPKALRPTQLITPPIHKEVLRAKPESSDHEKNTSPNILRIWKGYKNKSDPDLLAPYFSPHKLNNFEELSPITEAFKFRVEQKDSENIGKSPLKDSDFKCVLGETIAKSADSFFNEDKLENALRLYTISLGVFQMVPEQTFSMVCMGLVLKHLGMIKCRLGDVMGGCQLMEKAIDIFEKFPDQYSTVNIAKVWFELGLAYMEDQWNSESLLEHVTETIHSELDDLHVFQNEYTEYPSETDSDGDSESTEESYSVCTKEAITCFTHAYDMLRKVRSLYTNEQPHTDLYAEVLTKLGDCSIMTGNYDQAINLYEEGLHLFKLTMGSTNVVENAHVLSMMGVANFLLKHYPQATTILECAYLMQHHLYYAEEDKTFEVAFTLTMLAVSYYMIGKYDRCIQWCIKANNIYTYMYEDKMDELEDNKRWFIIQTIFVLGFSYGTLDFYDRSIEQLVLAREMCLKSGSLDRKQIVRIVKCLADVYSAMDDNDSALMYYNEALEYNIGYDEEDAAVLQNQLLNRTAGVHVNMKQYSTAAKYLEQALDVQKNMEDDIKGDLVTVLYQLGQTYALAGDIDKAIECYVECLDDYREEHGELTAVMCPTLANLATLCHVKGCLEDSDSCIDMIQKAKSNFLEALNLDNSANVNTLYANFLYCQGELAEALDVLLPFLQSDDFGTSKEIAFMGVELAILPEQIQNEIDELEEVFFDCNILAKFLAFLCYKQLNMIWDADDMLLSLYRDVLGVEKAPLPHCMMGYAMLEMKLIPEAAECFRTAAGMYDNTRTVAFSNYWTLVCTQIYVMLMGCLAKLLELANVTELPVLRYHPAEENEAEQQTGTRDSGYYENKDMWPSSETVGTVASQPSESDYHTQEEETSTNWQAKSHRLTPNDLPLVHKTTDDVVPLRSWEKSRSFPHSIDSSSQEFESWEFSSTETLETPDAIMKSLSDQNYIRNLTNMSFLEGDDMLSSCTTDEDEWTITEETVETPAILLTTLQRDDSREENKNQNNSGGIHTVVETVTKPIVWTSRMPDDNDKTVQDTRPLQDTRSLSGSSTSEEEGWTVYEETVEETPSAILAAMEASQQVVVPPGVKHDINNQDDHEVTVIEEVVDTPVAILKVIQGGDEVGVGGDKVVINSESIELEGQAKVEAEHEWIVSEEVVETPPEVLMALKQFAVDETGCKDGRRHDQPEQEVYEGGQHGWTVYEETVETPSSVLQALISRSNERSHDESGIINRKDDEINNMPESCNDEISHYSEDTWTVTEEVVETPTAILEQLIRVNENDDNTARNAKKTNEGEWIRIEQEQVIQTPSFILKSLSSSQTHLDKLDDERSSTPVEEWTITEEVIDTPSSVLQALIRRSQFNEDKQANRLTEWSVTTTDNNKDLSYSSKSQEPITTMVVSQAPPSNDSSDSHHTETMEWIVTEESLDTPIEILQVLQRQQAEQEHIVSPTSEDAGMHTNSSTSSPDKDGSEMTTEEWITEEIVEETPPDILQALRNLSVSPSSSSQAIGHEADMHERSHSTNMNDSHTQYSDTASRYSTNNSGDRGRGTVIETPDVYEEFDKTYKEMTNASRYRSLDNQQDTVVIETPPEILETIRNNNYMNRRQQQTDNGHKDSSHHHHHHQPQQQEDQDQNVVKQVVDDDDKMTTITWVTEEVVSTPLVILQALSQQQRSSANQSQASLPRHSMEHGVSSSMTLSPSTPEEEEITEVWTTFEETTVETPAAILALLSKS